MRRIEFTDEQIEQLSDPSQSTAALAREFGCSASPLHRWRMDHGIEAIRRLATPVSGRTDSDEGTVVTSGKVLTRQVEEAGGAEQYLRMQWNLPAEEWYCISCTGNQWEGPSKIRVELYSQVKGSFRPLKAISDIIPQPGKWTGPTWSKVRAKTSPAQKIVILGDHQAPYHDVELHESTLRLIEDVAPGRIVHLGDLCDYTNISKFRDHAYVKAEVDECTQAGVDILSSIRMASPDSQFQILPGNHDLRPMNELLARAERISGLKCGRLPGEDEQRQLISLKLLWRLDELGIELVDDPRGWEHSEVELLPGPKGLVVIHGFLTGENVAKRTLAKVGRSVIMGHTHTPEHYFSYSQQLGVEQQAVVAGCQCIVRGQSRHFPTFASHDNWLQGPVVATIFTNGEFLIERIRWTGSNLVTSWGVMY